MSVRLVKLVRDRVSRFTPVQDTHVRYETINDRAAAIEALRKKLIEEAAEYLLDPSPAELADVYEVVIALAHLDLEVPFEHVGNIAADKRQDRGGFGGLVGMYLAVDPEKKSVHG